MSIFISLVFACVGALITYGLFTHPSDDLNPRVMLMKFVGPIAVPMFLVLMVMAVMQLIDKRPALIVDDKGIYARTQFHELTMAWQDLAQLFVQERQVSLTTKIQILVLVPRDPNAAIMKAPEKSRRRLQNSLKMYGGFNVMLQQFPGNPRELGEAIVEYGRQQIVANPVVPPMVPPLVSS